MYAVEVRDHIMVAHSFKGEFFGPAQRLHGATFVVNVAFFREKLGPNDVVVDIGSAHEALAKHIFDRMVEAARKGALGPDSEGLAAIRVTLHESHVARA